MDEDRSDVRQRRLEAIAAALGVSVATLHEPLERNRLLELLRLWSALPGEAEQDAALAYLSALAEGTAPGH